MMVSARRRRIGACRMQGTPFLTDPVNRVLVQVRSRRTCSCMCRPCEAQHVSG